MRIIAGVYKGRVLKGPKHEGLRPTADRVRESLFNILSTKIEQADFLDLFAGTGANGLEALSRGANSVVFNDVNHASIKLLQANISFLPADTNFQVLKLDAERAVKLLASKKQFFDIIFLDPPFEAGLLPGIITLISETGLLLDDGILIAEHPRNAKVDNVGWKSVSTRNYGDIALTFYQK